MVFKQDNNQVKNVSQNVYMYIVRMLVKVWINLTVILLHFYEVPGQSDSPDMISF